MKRQTGPLLGQVTIGDRTYRVHLDDRGAELRNSQNKTVGHFRVVAGTPLIINGPRCRTHDQYRDAVDHVQQLVNNTQPGKDPSHV